MKINIAIDGPSAAGKSTIADIIADRLGYTHLDTGAMYRSVALEATRKGIDYEDEDALVKMIAEMKLEMPADGSVILEGEDVSEAIRTNEISMASSAVSKHPGVRKAMVKKQQEISAEGGYILDGRDIGTVVLTDAPVKIYLVASAEARAKRRVLQNIESGLEANYDEILEDIIQRDYQDMHREASPLCKAEDAVEIDSSDLTIEEVVAEAMKLIEKAL